MEFQSTLTIELVLFSVATTALITISTYFLIKKYTNATNMNEVIGKIF